jgi:hypothetical protein
MLFLNRVNPTKEKRRRPNTLLPPFMKSKRQRRPTRLIVLHEDKTKKGKLRKYALRDIAKLEELLKSKRESMEDQEAQAQAVKEEQAEAVSEIEDEEVEDQGVSVWRGLTPERR